MSTPSVRTAPSLRGTHTHRLARGSAATSTPTTEIKFSDTLYQDVSDEEFDAKLSPAAIPKSVPTVVFSQLPISLQRSILARGCGTLTTHSTASSGHGWEDYSLRIVTAGAVTTSAGGIVANVYSADPSNLSLAEWSNFAALFDEVKLESFTLAVTSYSGQSAPAISSIAMGSFLNKGSTPSTILSVLTAPDGRLVSPNMTRPETVTLHPGALGYAPTTSPAGTTAYGCPGYIHLYCTGVASTSIMTYSVVGRYHLRGRM